MRAAVKSHRVLDTRHVGDRMAEKDVIFSEIYEVLANGYHEKAKDEFKPEFDSWNYAIRGKTFEGRELRIPIYFEKDKICIVTVFDPTVKWDD